MFLSLLSLSALATSLGPPGVDATQDGEGVVLTVQLFGHHEGQQLTITEEVDGLRLPVAELVATVDAADDAERQCLEDTGSFDSGWVPTTNDCDEDGTEECAGRCEDFWTQTLELACVAPGEHRWVVESSEGEQGLTLTAEDVGQACTEKGACGGCASGQPPGGWALALLAGLMGWRRRG